MLTAPAAEAAITIDPGRGVTVTADLAHGIARVWALVGDFAGLERWHPTIVSCVVRDTADGLTRTARLADGWIEERLERCDAATTTLIYRIVGSSRPATTGTVVTIVLTSVAAGSTQLAWQARAAGPVADPALAALGDYYRARIGHLRTALAGADGVG